MMLLASIEMHIGELWEKVCKLKKYFLGKWDVKSTIFYFLFTALMVPFSASGIVWYAQLIESIEKCNNRTHIVYIWYGYDIFCKEKDMK